jgi:putative protease
MDPVELLAPAQNIKSIKAVAGVANAVYFGTEALNMRMNAANISLKDLKTTVEMCHAENLKAYLTTNVIIYENELNYLEELLATAKDSGIDAVILHDMATMVTAKDLNLPFHISTQMSVSNAKSARFYESLGAERIILARECSLNQMREIAAKLQTAKIEAFVHGAQCTSVSGRCYFSTFVNNDPVCSANRGKCLQPCRHKWTLTHPNGTQLDYHEGFFLNSKDLCMIEHIPKLIDAQIASFKIEGRMRDPHYIATVAQCYREAIEATYDGTFTADKAQDWLHQLKQVYNRGFSTGFYFGRPGPEDISVDLSGNQATTKKVQIGKVITYYRNVKAAKIQLNSGHIKLGDELIFEGAKTGSFVQQKITSIQIKMKAVTVTPEVRLGKPILLSIGVDSPVKKGDWVYKYLTKK